MLLRLPEAASTVMSAEPAIARVQPTSPTTLFLMGVAQGRTTVIALGDNGTPIGQYDVIVSPGLGREPASSAAPVGVGAPRVMPISAELARAIQLAIHRTVPGSASVTAQGAGGRLLLRGAVPNALAGSRSRRLPAASLAMTRRSSTPWSCSPSSIQVTYGSASLRSIALSPANSASTGRHGQRCHLAVRPADRRGGDRQRHGQRLSWSDPRLHGHQSAWFGDRSQAAR